jgi:putative tricarboxylic transport membrane protein
MKGCGDIMALLQIGFEHLIAHPVVILYMLFGMFMGLVFGTIPGLTGALAITLLLPFTFLMAPTDGLFLLIAIYVGGVSGGLCSAILLNIPGTPAAIITTYDGAPMARKGRPAEALAIGVLSSVIGGLISAFALILIAPQLAKLALKFGPWEYFAMGMMGLCVVISLTSKTPLKGFMSAVVGILLACVGTDPISAVSRYSFTWQMDAGLDVLPVLMGLFAVAEILTQVKTMGREMTVISVSEKIPLIPKKEYLKGDGKNLIVSSLIGIFIGILPGVGQTTSSLLAYNTQRQSSKNPEEYGTGIKSGIIASESANNACCGGALIPMMTMGIPGDLVTAILLGGLIVHGLQPGPMLFQYNKDVVGVIFVSYLLSNILMFIIFMLLMRFFIKILNVPMHYLFPIILVMCVIGSFAINNRLFDAWVLFIIGIAGYLLLNLGFSLAPIVLGFVLGPIVELNYRTAIVTFKGDITTLFERPISIGLLLFGIAMVIIPELRKRKRP